MNTQPRNPEETGSPPPTIDSSVHSSPKGQTPLQPNPAPGPSRHTSHGDDLTAPEQGPEPQTKDSPRRVGKYTILGEVQAGGMGIVYKAQDPQLRRTVALKMMRAGVLATQQENIRFRREAEAAAQLDHPNIIPVYEIDQHEGCLYFTMPFAWGGSLADDKTRFLADHRAAVALVEQVARAVHHAHRRGILHRDLKPANILLDEQGVPWVSDFGLAKLCDASLELTYTGQVMGTPSYMAPEQASGQTKQVSAQTDVWALGVILYELLTGQRPFQGKTRDEQLRQIRTTDPPRPCAVSCSLDRLLETVILKCLEKEPSQRYPSAEALADDLARWLRGEPIVARPPSWPVRIWRAPRRYHSLALRLGFLLALMALLAFAGKEWSGRKFQQAMDDLTQRAKKEKVELIRESGAPDLWRWQPHRTDARAMLGLDQIFRVYAQEQPAMVELLSAAPRRFRLRAEVQHCSGRGVVGFYFGHGAHPTEEGAVHCFFRVAFNDRVPQPKPPGEIGPAMNEVRLTLPIYREQTGAAFFRQVDVTCAISRQFAPAGEVETMPWRTLEVEVTPERIKSFWGGELIRGDRRGMVRDSCNPNEPLEHAAGWLLKYAPWHPEVELILGGGMGLFVEQGIAAFRSVVIEPLPQQ
jgi:tRNA A-37 threonylcarbamoyl transferase component Bud32